MEKDIIKIITDGTLAPSGENCQPWKFIVKQNRIYIFNVPELDQSIYNYMQKGSYVAHGALIENIVISASNYSYDAEIKLFPKDDQPNLISTITLEKKDIKVDELYSYLEKRHTNRKDHKNLKLSDDQKLKLIDTGKNTGFGEFKVIDDQMSLNILGKALAVNEQIIFENRELHKFFYSHLLWNEQDQNKAGGFYIKTLEFLPHQLKGVRIFKRWPILKILNKIGKVSQVIAKENAEKYTNSGALAIVAVDGNDRQAYVNAGRLAERVWLKATQLGLSVQPCTGVLFFMENINGGNESVFSEKHVQIIKKAYKDIIETFQVQNKTTPMLFRIGYADIATAKARRMKPIIAGY
jgi:nitroreductase